jgi:hypothetical protein
MHYRASQLVAALALLAACSGPNKSPEPVTEQTASIATPNAPDELANVEITLVRSECGGGYCPNYTVVIDGTGRVKYTGRSFVLTIGEREEAISPDAVRSLLHQFEEAKFLSLNDRYRYNVRDWPTTYLTLRIGNQSKRVENYFSAPDDNSHGKGPEWTLDDLAKSIDAAVNIDQWIGTWDERREYYVGGAHGWGHHGRTELDE